MLNLREKIGADYLATGHYAKITEHNGEYWLEKANDLNSALQTKYQKEPNIEFILGTK